MTRRIRLALPALFLGLVAAAGFWAPADAAVPAEASLLPSLSPPSVAAEQQGQYFTLLLKWTRDVVVGRVKARVTYLDPPLYLAWLRQTTPDIDQAGFERQLSGFPTTLRFRVAYQAAERSDLHAKDWSLSLQGADATVVPVQPGKRIAPADLKSGPSGDFWEDAWDYQVSVPAGFFTSQSKGFTVSLSGPGGQGKVSWSFGDVQRAASSADGYVVPLGIALTAICVALLAALYLTRPPRASIA